MYQKKQVFLGRSSQEGLIKGVNILADAVKSTLGPKGRFVVISNLGKNIVTKDGVSVARMIHLEDPLADMGAQLVKQAAAKTGAVAGDGTTTSTVLAQALIKEAVELMQNNPHINAIDIKNKIEQILLPKLVEQLKSISSPILDYNMIEQVARISANNDDQIGNLIREAYEKVTFNGIIAVEESKLNTTTVEMIEGMEFDGGYFTSVFATDPKTLLCEYDNVGILVVDGKINNPSNLIRLLNQCAKNGKALLIIADELDVQSMALLNINKVQAGIKVVAVRPPLWGTKRRDYIIDIAVLTGASIVSEVSGLTMDKVDISHLGSCDRIRVSNKTTTLIGGKGSREAVEQRIETIKALKEIEATDWGKNKIEERIAKLSTGIALIKVGGFTEAEMKEKKDRIEDAIYATRAAIEEGCVIGGGNILYYCAHRGLEDQNSTEVDKVFYRAIKYPLTIICNNAGVTDENVENIGKQVIDHIDKFDSFNYGYNAATGQIGDIWAEGVIDPTKVVRVALENAVSIAGMILTSQCAVAELPNNEANFEEGLPDDIDQYDPELIGI